MLKILQAKPKNIIAVTGTNGKTSVTDLFYQILKLNNKPVASIGTLGVKFNGKFIKTKLTSPDTISIHQILEKIKKKGLIMLSLRPLVMDYTKIELII